MKTILYIICLSLLSFKGFAQEQEKKYIITGNVKEQTTKQSLPGASIVYGVNKGVITDFDGNFKIECYTVQSKLELTFNFIGFEVKTIEIELSTNSIDLKTIYLEEDVQQLDEIVVKGNPVLARQKNDTLSFSASAVKVHSEAKGINIVKKLPGFTLTENKIETQGEEIKKVFINGKPFYNDDPKNALNALPSEIIKSIEVFDDYGEVASFTGYSSGNSVKAINIVTKDSYKDKPVGQYSIGVGTEGKYAIEGNTFKNYDNADLSLSVERNNVNESNLDLSGFNSFSEQLLSKFFGQTNDQPQNLGEQTISGFGLNYNKTFSPKSEFSFNYTTGKLKNDLYQNTLQNYQDIWNYQINDSTQSETKMHKLNLKWDYQLNDNNKFIFSEKIMLQKGDVLSSTQNSGTFGDVLPITNSVTDKNIHSEKYAINSSLIWLHKFDRQRSLTAYTSLNFNGGETDKNIESSIINNTYEGQELTETITQNINQQDIYDEKDNSAQLLVSYKEPIGFLKSLNLVLKSKYGWRDQDKFSYLLNPTTQLYDDFDTSISSQLNSSYWSNTAELGFSSFGIKSIFNIGVSLENTQLQNEFTYLNEGIYEKDYNRIYPMFYGKYFFSPNSNLIFFGRSKTIVPTTSQLLPVTDVTDPLQVYAGNPDLDLGTMHIFMTRFTHTLSGKSQYLSAYSFLKYSDSFIGLNSRFLTEEEQVYGVTLSQGTKVTTPINLNGLFNISAGVDYSFPVSFIKSNINAGLKYNYNHIPTILDETELISNNHKAGLQFGIASNISQDIDFNISSFTAYNSTSNSENDSSSEFLTADVKAEANFVFWKKVKTNFEYQLSSFNYFGEESNQNYQLLNVGVGFNFLKNNKASFNIEVYDILNQNKGLAYNLNETYTEQIQSNALEQHIMFTLKFQL